MVLLSFEEHHIYKRVLSSTYIVLPVAGRGCIAGVVDVYRTYTSESSFRHRVWFEQFEVGCAHFQTTEPSHPNEQRRITVNAYGGLDKLRET